MAGNAVSTLAAPLRELFDRIEPHADLVAPTLPRIADALTALAADHDYLAPAIADLGDTSGLARSEERRGGKECRSRWSP